ncbi:nuclear transport factor 2 family protein [Luteolibacter yonseiensis]|uniref:Nuclear transport factor 2 family protein n=1 Tax=Luteolibacter yonseiensis TaxID=1144680 RepID=A0A934R889_9BACT|nr:nuclear transport factor 2 family protein [Luteolibacter yonseiensis]MBK1817738.1 nuclear transport factor 2 family protein [Luteolibacter yonseiensis]
MNPPDIIIRYFNAANAGNIDEACDCFASDAAVSDEGQTHEGNQSIRTWIDSTTKKYHPQVEMLRIGKKDTILCVTGLVSGDFPGSPAELDYQFTLQNNTISNLSIG